MTQIVHLAPHDPIPGGPGRRVVVLRRFDEDSPRTIVISILLTGDPDETVRPTHPDGKKFTFEETIAAARRVAESERLGHVYVIDRIGGKREQDVLRHGGDHTAQGQALADTDLEEGERGPDMRDRTP